jgi:diguanylate cyclase (GGDEF)-like protein
MLENKAPLEDFLPNIVDLCFKIVTDYESEISKISKRLTSIIQALIFTEQEYSQFLDQSINYLDRENREFTYTVSDSLGSIQKTVSDFIDRDDPENLLLLVVERFDRLFKAVQKKKDEDELQLALLNKEKEFLQTRLDMVRRDYDSFVSQSRKTLKELEAVRSISLRDALTSVYNRRAYDEQIKLTLENYGKGELSTFGLILFDIDNFREINNTYGHLAGDSILGHMGRLTKETLRCDDFVFRYGGDEFIILLPEAKLRDAVKVAEKLRQQIENVEFRLSRTSEQSVRLTISLGVTEVEKDDTVSAVLARADKALYESKFNGRNRVTSR